MVPAVSVVPAGVMRQASSKSVAIRMSKSKLTLLFALCATITLLADLGFKYWCREYRPDLLGWRLADVVSFHFHQNAGMMLGIGSNLDAPFGRWIILGLSGLLLLALATVLLVRGFSFRQSAIAWGLVVGGGLSNWLDRLANGAVTDVVRLDLGLLQTGIFNLADLANLIGLTSVAAMIVWRDRFC